MVFDRLDADYRYLEAATDTAVMLKELGRRKSSLSDEDLGPVKEDMLRKRAGASQSRSVMSARSLRQHSAL